MRWTCLFSILLLNFVSCHRIDGTRIDPFVNYRDVATIGRESKDDRQSRGPTSIMSHRIEKNVLNILRRQVMFGDMLDVAAGLWGSK